MPKIGKILKIFFPLVLASIAVVLCIKNYTSGTYLIGWDSMHPEFNFPLNISRMFSHVWASEQGVGAISAHSDMSDLPRIILLWIISMVVPVDFTRYIYVFSCLIIGPLGVYFFLKYIFQREKENPWIYPSSFLGGLFYLLNLGTLQNFYVPLEMFTVAFAGVPWLFLTATKYLRNGKKSSLISASLVSILIAPMAYAATQAYAIYFGLFLFLIVLSLISSSKKLKLKRFLLLGIVILALNIYWILPNIYSILQQSLTISNANINRLFSQESFLRNADYGNLANVAIQKSFLFSWRSFDFSAGKFDDLLKIWNVYLDNRNVFLVGFILIFLSLLGILIGIVKRNKTNAAFLLPLALCLFFLFNVNPPTGHFYEFLYSHFAVFREGFRTPFTKFSVLFEFILSFYFGYFCYKFFSWKVKYSAFFKICALFWISGGIILFFLPAFFGNMIGKNVRIAFPGEYAQLFSWFKTHHEGRVALMPINTKFGWEYRNWGYEGSGFLTYGVPNPVLYRDFDRWNSSNEDFYTQSAFALYSNDSQAFISTLKKFNVKYLLLDESIVNAGGTEDVLKVNEIKSIAVDFGMEKVANFGYLTVYDTGSVISDVFAPTNYSRVNVNLSYASYDPIYQNLGDYINQDGLTYPFINLDKRSKVEINIVNDEIRFNNSQVGAGISLPIESVIKTDLSVNQGFSEAYNCDLKGIGTVSKEITESGVWYKATGGGASCDYVSFPILEYSRGYVLHITGENKTGRSLKIYLFDSISQNPILEEILPVGKFNENYFIYPRNLKGEGYVLNFETRSFGRIPSENLITNIEFYPVDYAYLSNYALNTQDAQGQTLYGVYSNLQSGAWQNNIQIQDVKKYGTWGYKVNIETGDEDREGLVALGQGYERGWLAVGVSQSWSELVASETNSLADKLRLISTNFNLLQHVKVNGWANGWIVPESEIPDTKYQILVFYWPQALEWGGMAIGVITILVILVKVRRS